MRKNIILIFFILIGIRISAQTITTNLNTQYQVIDGFGAFYNPSGSDTATAHKLFSDLGLTIMRTTVPWGEEYMDDDGIPFDTGAYAGRYNRNTFKGNPFALHLNSLSYNDNGTTNSCWGNGDLASLVPFLQDMQNIAAKYHYPYKLFSSDWSPPHWMKYDPCIFGTDEQWNKVDNGMGPNYDYLTPLGTYSPTLVYEKGQDALYSGSNPYQRFAGGQAYQFKNSTSSSGHLPTDTAYWFLDERKNMYLELAEYHAGYIELLQEQGINLYAIGMQNEPSFGETYGSCVYSGGQYRDALQAHDSLFKFHNININMLGPEDMADNYEPWTSTILPNPVANKRLNIFSVHGYTNGVAASPADSALWGGLWANVAPSGKHLWMSETSGYSSSWLDTGSTPGSFSIARAIFNALKNGHVSAWVWWSLSDGSDDVYCLEANLVPTKKYYASKQYYRYIRPGAVMVDAQSNDTSVLSAAFLDGAESMLTYILINNSSVQKTVSINQTNLPANVAVYLTDATENCVTVNSNYSSGKVTLPPTSITTVVFTGTIKSPTINKPNDTILLANTGQCVIKLTGISDGNNDNDALNVSLTASSSNNAVIPTPTLTKISDSTYNLKFTPATDTGTVTITVNLTDNGSTDLFNSSFTTFHVTVIPFINKAPTIDSIPDQNFSYVSNKKYTIPLSGISDGNNGSETLTFILTSSNNAITRALKVNYTAGTTGTITFNGLAAGTSTITLEIQNSGGTDLGGQNTTIVSFGLTLSVASELNAPEGKQLSVYPVPATDYINLILPDESFREIMIVDITGRVVLQQSVYSSSATINVASLAKGVYIVIAKNNQDILQTKITKE